MRSSPQQTDRARTAVVDARVELDDDGPAEHGLQELGRRPFGRLVSGRVGHLEEQLQAQAPPPPPPALAHR